MGKAELTKLMRTRRDKATQALRVIIRRHGGNYSAAAREIGVSYMTLWRWRNALAEDGYKLDSAAA